MIECSLSFTSRTLGVPSRMEVLVPEGEGPFPVLYLLHGLGDDCRTWQRNYDLPHRMEKRGVIVVMPEGGRSYYCDVPGPVGEPWESHITGDVVGVIDQTFDTVRDASGRALAGFSMGGYGAIMLALRHPEMFCAAASVSGAMYFAARPHPLQLDYPADLMALLPAGKYDCFALAEKHAAAVQSVAMRLSVGRQDYLQAVNAEFHRHLEALGLKHDYTEADGKHDWAFCRAHLHEAIDFCVERLRR